MIQLETKYYQKIAVVIPNVMGGVLQYNLNLIRFLSSSTTYFYLIITDREQNNPIPDNLIPDEIEVRKISIHRFDNKYYVLKRLKEAISHDTTHIILNDLIEYDFVNHFSLSAIKISIIHGDYAYYYDLAIAAKDNIDFFMGVSKVIYNKLLSQLPDRKNDIINITPLIGSRFEPNSGNTMPSDTIRILFVGRLTKEKGFDKLLPIYDKVNETGISCSWTIVAPHTTTEFDSWLNKSDIIYFNYIPNDQLIEKYQVSDILILLSEKEGFPLALAESMSCGVIPIVSDLNSGISELVIHGESGFIVEPDDTNSILEIILRLYKNRSYLHQIKLNAQERCQEVLQTELQIQTWRSIFNTIPEYRPFISRPIKAGWLDQIWLPNSITKILRYAIR